MPRRIGRRERWNPQGFQSLQHRRRHALDVRLNVAHVAGGQIVQRIRQHVNRSVRGITACALLHAYSLTILNLWIRLPRFSLT